jgi:hypothetical protein
MHGIYLRDFNLGLRIRYVKRGGCEGKRQIYSDYYFIKIMDGRLLKAILEISNKGFTFYKLIEFIIF